MPKKILFESAIHQFNYAGKRLLERLPEALKQQVIDFLDSTEFSYQGTGQMTLTWSKPQPGSHALSFKEAQFYVRGDTPAFMRRQEELHMTEHSEDQVMANNEKLFDQYLLECLSHAGVRLGN